MQAQWFHLPAQDAIVAVAFHEEAEGTSIILPGSDISDSKSDDEIKAGQVDESSRGVIDMDHRSAVADHAPRVFGSLGTITSANALPGP